MTGNGRTNLEVDMRIILLRIVLALALAWGAVQVRESFAAEPATKAAFVFRGSSYFHRWSQNEQHEFTPEEQEDLEKWSDMLTINGYPSVSDGEALATSANSVLENYKNHQAKVLKTRSVPRTSNHPAEHLIAVVFTRPNLSEAAFARFKLVEGEGCSLVYSHRFYGEEAAEEMSAWLKANGDQVETALMEWSSIPSPAQLRQERL